MNSRKTKANLCPYALMTCALIIAGCTETQRYETVKQICVPDITKTEAMQIAENVLGEMHFTIAKSDAEFGVIRTKPLPGAQFFEFWRKDNVGPSNTLEANLHTIRRIAELDIKQQDTQLCINCNVDTQRLRLPEREIGSRSQAYGLFSRSSLSRQTLKLHHKQRQGMAWVNLGQDKQLATVILKQIESKIAKMQKGKSL